MHATAEPGPPRRGPALRLWHKLSLAVLLLAAAMLAVLLLLVGPSTTAAFRAASDELVRRSTAAMQALTQEQTAESRAVLVDLIAHDTDARRRALADEPLGIHPTIEGLRAAIQREDEQRSARLRANVAVLDAEQRRRSDARIAAVLADLAREQEALAAQFGHSLRRAHLWLCSALLLVATLLLGFGLYQLVVRPVTALRLATRRVADGDLGAAVPAATGDELGALAADFSAMLGQLRRSRAELDALNRDLEAQVRQKTRELAHAEKMASLGTLAGGIAHEFNNLIGGIKGCAQEARRDETDPERQETLDVILRAADRAAGITAQLRRFARRDPGRRQDVALEQVARDALRLAEPEARRRGVTVVRELDRPLPAHADGDALHQVFVNLLTNALQAMPHGGTLTVSGARDGEAVRVTVRDTGGGIAEQDLGRIFEPFFSRKADEPDPAQRGTGLGLSVSYGIVEAHGGALEVDSAVGVGTAVTVRLPAR
ncbi:MAG: sensor histidine kinase [Planctomycetota bacterium]